MGKRVKKSKISDPGVMLSPQTTTTTTPPPTTLACTIPSLPPLVQRILEEKFNPTDLKALRYEFRDGLYRMDMKQPWWELKQIKPIRSMVCSSFDGMTDIGILRLFDVKLLNKGISLRALCIGWVWVESLCRERGIATELISRVKASMDMHEVQTWIKNESSRKSVLGHPWATADALILFSSEPHGGLYAKHCGFHKLSDLNGGLWAYSLIPGVDLQEHEGWHLDTDEHL